MPQATLLNEILNQFLPAKLEVDAKNSEMEVIIKFITELNQIRKYHILKDFSNSYVMNITMLNTTYSFVSIFDIKGVINHTGQTKTGYEGPNFKQRMVLLYNSL